MGKALAVDVTPRELKLAKYLLDGHKDWEDLTTEQKMVLLQSRANLEGLVTDEQIRRFQLERSADRNVGVLNEKAQQIRRLFSND